MPYMAALYVCHTCLIYLPIYEMCQFHGMYIYAIIHAIYATYELTHMNHIPAVIYADSYVIYVVIYYFFICLIYDCSVWDTEYT